MARPCRGRDARPERTLRRSGDTSCGDRDGDAAGDLVRRSAGCSSSAASSPCCRSSPASSCARSTSPRRGWSPTSPARRSSLAAGVTAIVLFVARRVAASASAVAAVAHLAARAHPGAPLPRHGDAGRRRPPTLTVMTLNMFFGEADAGQIVAAVRTHGVELLAAQELTHDGVEALRRAGIEDAPAAPRAEPRARRRAAGCGAPRRSTPRRSPTASAHQQVAATTTLAGRELSWPPSTRSRRTPTTPRSGRRRWARLAEWFDDVEGPAVVLGDFNATLDHHQFRELLGRAWPTPPRRSGPGGCRRSRPTGGACRCSSRSTTS